MTTRRLVAYPFLAATYPVLGLAAANGGDLVSAGDLVRPLAISLGAAVLAWLLSRAVTRDIDARGFLTFIGVGVFSAHGYAINILARWVPSGVAALPVAILPVLAAGVLAWRGRVSFGPLTRYLNLVIAIMVAWSGASLLWRLRPRERAIAFEDLPLQTIANAAPSGKALPHLFVIVLDKYTGHRSLKANFGFDNTPFERTLEGLGFVVPRAARANYMHTFLALAAMLNWEYLDNVARRIGSENPDWGIADPLIEDNRTWRTLHRLGYRFVFMPTAYPATGHNRYADLQLPDPGRLTHEFEAVWLRGTMLLPVLERACAVFSCSGGVPPYVPESATSLDWKFAAIPGLVHSERPVFVLAHLTVPHEPYVYDADCGHRRPYWPNADDGPDAETGKAAYVAQVRCVNRKVEELVKAILGRSTRPAIILLQADHGHGRLGRDLPPLSGASAARVEERIDIFAAYLLPGAPRGLVHDSIGPVNTMRSVMRYYYGLDLPPLEDASYWSSAGRPYEFTRVR